MVPILLAVAIGAIVGACRRPMGTHLETPELEMVWLAGVGVGLQALGAVIDLPADGFLLALSLGALAAFAFWNRHLVGMGVLAFGVGCNAVAVAFHGAMPVRATALIDSGAATAAELATTDLGFGRRFERNSDPAPWLGDVIPVDLVHAAMSFGDLVALVGIAVVAGELARYTRRGTRWSLADVVRVFVIIEDPDEPGDADDGTPGGSEEPARRTVNRLRSSGSALAAARRPDGNRPAGDPGR